MRAKTLLFADNGGVVTDLPTIYRIATGKKNFLGSRVSGLFKSILCQERGSCSRNPCLFSHEDLLTSTNNSNSIGTLRLPTIVTTNVNDPGISSPPTPKVVPSKRPLTIEHSPANYTSHTTSQTDDDRKCVGEPPKKLIKLDDGSGISPQPSQPKLSRVHGGAPVVKARPATSQVPIPTRQAMLTTLYEHFAALYVSILSQQPQLAADHALAQEEEVYLQSSKYSYRNAMISSVAQLKKRPKPDSVSHPSVGTSGEIAKREEAKKSLQALRVTREQLVPLLLTPEQAVALGYVVEIPEGPGGDKPSLEGSEFSRCDRCRKPFVVIPDLDATDCVYHWGRLVTLKVAGESERKRVHSCCSQLSNSEGCSRGPHVFYEKDAVDLHSRFPFSSSDEIRTGTLEAVALDCEMIYTTAGMRLARVSIVDGGGELVLDEHIRMEEGISILDYNTRFSGVSTLDEATLDLEAVRSVLTSYIGESTVIIGHALENDLKALRLVHQKCVDTVVLFPHRAGLPYRRSLRDLVHEKLGQTIQTGGGSTGHSSVEDARSTLDLVRWYLLHAKGKTSSALVLSVAK